MTKELTTINPATEEVIKTYEIMTKEQINEKAKKAQNAYLDWKKDIQKRADHIHDFAQELRKNNEELARKVTKEMGKAIKEARSEVEKCAWVMDYFADNGKVFTTDEIINTSISKKKHQHEAEIQSIIQITRDEPFLYYYENTNFSVVFLFVRMIRKVG
jgi:acyl-CoA reductase-like NAD-dependent aldehyde dehydrogenase